MAERLKSERQDTAKALLRNHTIAPRKMRLVIDLVRGMAVDKALNVLKFTEKAGALPVRKLLVSAIANWESKNEGSRVEDANLYIKEAFVDAGRTLKRFQPAPQGRAHRIRKRSSHVTLILDTKEEN
ncbi:MAG TPA: 50S ribosomal protein L22 [Bacteroidia bacterium]|nr:50S ribosomal protein L22 [Bacteroidia bacterium]